MWLIWTGHDDLHAVVFGYGNDLLVGEYWAQFVVHEAEQTLAVALAHDEQQQVSRKRQ